MPGWGILRVMQALAWIFGTLGFLSLASGVACGWPSAILSRGGRIVNTGEGFHWA